MNNTFLQPLITIAALKEYESCIVSKPQEMYIYSFEHSNSDSGNSTLKFIPSPMNELIICYNNTGLQSYVFFVNAVTKPTTYLLPHFDRYLGIRFADTSCFSDKEICDTKAVLVSKLQSALTLADKADIAGEYIEKNIQDHPTNNTLKNIIKVVKDSKGAISVANISEISGYSCRHIQRLFNSYFGFGAKDYCRFIRFQYVLLEMMSDPDRDNSEYITDSGYSDQAHFQREFKSFTDMTPKQFIKLYKSTQHKV